LAAAGVNGGLSLARKPEWMRVKLHTGPEFLRVRRAVREHQLATVCEEAGCPNMAECWNDGTATFMVLGDRCTRACGFCLVDTRRPLEVDLSEPERLADAVEQLGLRHVVITMVARDDVVDGGMAVVARCVETVRARCPGAAIETLVSDAGGDRDALAVLFAARPDVFNHNIETVARLQRAVRPSAGYARSLAVLASAKAAGLTTKSGLIVGMGEAVPELHGALVDLAGVGVEIVTIGQYLQPTAAHLPVARWVQPAEFEGLADFGRALGIRHVESGPLVRSSYHARAAATVVAPTRELEDLR
jgi:lipoic acid synthetase